MPEKIAIDNNVHNFLVDALYNGYTLGGDTVDQERLAVLRCYLYLGDLYIPPTVATEYAATQNSEKHGRLQSMARVLLNEIVAVNEIEINKGLLIAKRHHHKDKDCRIFAESQAGGMDVLLTFDQDMLRLNNADSSIRVETPSRYWIARGIPRGATPCLMPDSSNPLFHNEFWRW